MEKILGHTHFCRMVGWSISFFPKTIRCEDHFKHSSTTVLIHLVTPQTIIHLSWLKLLTTPTSVTCKQVDEQIRTNHGEPFMFHSQKVFYRYLDLVELDKGGASSGAI